MPSVRSRLVSAKLVEVPREADVRQRGRLVDDRVRLRLEHGLAHCPGVEQIELRSALRRARERVRRLPGDR